MKRRNIYSGLVMTAAALLCLAGCKKDEEGEKIMLGTQFEKAVSAQKTYLGDDNYVCWNTNDSVFVNGEKYKGISSNGIEVKKAEDDNYYAVYPAIDGNEFSAEKATVVIPAVQTYRVESDKQVLDGPMAAFLNNEGNSLYFRNLYSLLKVTVAADDKNFTVNSITVTGTKALAGSYTFDGTTLGTNPTVGEIGTGSCKVTLKCNTVVSANSDKDFYIVVHPMAEQDLTVKVKGVLDGKMVVYTYNTASERTLNRSRIGGLAVNLQQLTAEAFKGFSVGTDTYVTFSPGNLQYQASPSPGRWQFAEHQYDYIGNKAGNNTTTNRDKQTSWIDLFGWGTSGFAGMNPDMTSSIATAYPTSNISGTNYDWGVNNEIHDGSTTYPKGTWRTLTSDEWNYLLITRGKEHKDWWIYNMVNITINSTTTKGLIIYPDGVTINLIGGKLEKEVDFKTLMNPKVGDDNISEAEFEVLEAAGCVFLPAAGFRTNTTVYNANEYCDYWSSTYDATKIENVAYYLHTDSRLLPSGSGSHTANAVRLVKDIE